MSLAITVQGMAQDSLKATETKAKPKNMIKSGAVTMTVGATAVVIGGIMVGGIYTKAITIRSPDGLETLGVLVVLVGIIAIPVGMVKMTIGLIRKRKSKKQQVTD